MKRLLSSLPVALLLVSTVQAQEIPRFRILTNVGFPIPLAPDALTDFTGAHAGGGLSYAVSDRVLFVGSVDWNYFSDKPPNGKTLTINNLYGSVGIRFHFTENVNSARPYFVGGIGLFELSDAIEKSSVGFHVGFGVEGRATSRVSVFLEGVYVHGLTSGESTAVLPLRIGLGFGLGQMS